MRSGMRFILSTLAAAFLLIPLSGLAGEGANDSRPSAQDWSYFCQGAYHSNSPYTFYITGVHHLRVQNPALGPQLDDTRPVDEAWRQALTRLDPHVLTTCVYAWTRQIQSRRQQVLSNNPPRVVNVEWEYGQSGPAVASQ